MADKLNQFIDELYETYNNSSINDLLSIAKVFYVNANSVEESSPQFYNYQSSQLMKGNPWVPYNNAVDTMLTNIRVATYDSDVWDRFSESARQKDEVTIIANLCWAYMFLNKAHKLEPFNPEVLQLTKAIFDQLKTVSKFTINDSNDILLAARNMFKGYMSNKWTQECDSLLNSERKITRQELQVVPSLYQSEDYSKEQLQSMYDRLTKTAQTVADGQTPFDMEHLNIAGLTCFVRGKLMPDTKNKMIYYKASDKCFNQAMSLLIPRIKDNILSPEDIDKAQIITTNQIALYDEMNKMGMQKDSGKLLTISKLLKERKEAMKRIKCYSSDGTPIYE